MKKRYILSIESRLFSTLLFQFIISFTFGQQFEKKRNKLDVLSEEPYPLRRGGVTGRANRLMMCDDRDDDARDGPALRSSGTRLVSEVSRVTERAAWHWDVHLPPPIYHHIYYSRAVIRGESRGEIPVDRVIVRTSILFIVITGEQKERERKRESETQPPLSTLSGKQTFVYVNNLHHQYIYISSLFLLL